MYILSFTIYINVYYVQLHKTILSLIKLLQKKDMHNVSKLLLRVVLSIMWFISVDFVFIIFIVITAIIINHHYHILPHRVLRIWSIGAFFVPIVVISLSLSL